MYLEGTAVEVNVPQITVRRLLSHDADIVLMASRHGTSYMHILQALGVRCIAVEGSVDEKTKLPQFNASCVQYAVREILDSVSEE